MGSEMCIRDSPCGRCRTTAGSRRGGRRTGLGASARARPRCGTRGTRACCLPIRRCSLRRIHACGGGATLRFRAFRRPGGSDLRIRGNYPHGVRSGLSSTLIQIGQSRFGSGACTSVSFASIPASGTRAVGTEAPTQLMVRRRQRRSALPKTQVGRQSSPIQPKSGSWRGGASRAREYGALGGWRPRHRRRRSPQAAPPSLEYAHCY